MNRNTHIIFFLIFIIVYSYPSNAYVTIKKSKSGICHDTSSPYYNKTMNFEAFMTMKACLNSDGRLPKIKSYYEQVEKEVKKTKM